MDRNKDQFKNWQLCGVWKLPFCDHKALKLTQNCVCITNQCINLLVLPSFTCEYHPKVFELFRPASLYCHLQLALAWVSGETQHLGLSSANCIPAWSHAAENRSSACWRRFSEGASSPKSSATSKRLISQVLTVTPRRLSCYGLPNSYRLWKGAVTRHILVWVQQLRWMVVM